MKQKKDKFQTKVTVMGTNESFTAKSEAPSLIFPASKIPWRILPRNDILVLKIEYAQSQKVE